MSLEELGTPFLYFGVAIFLFYCVLEILITFISNLDPLMSLSPLISVFIYAIITLFVLLVGATLVLSLKTTIGLFKLKDFDRIYDVVVKAVVVQSIAVFIGICAYVLSPNQAELAAKYNLPYIDLGIFRNTDDLDLKVIVYNHELERIEGEEGEFIGGFDTSIVLIEIFIVDPRLDRKLDIGGTVNDGVSPGDGRPSIYDGVIGRVDEASTAINEITLKLSGSLSDSYEIIYSALFSNSAGQTLKHFRKTTGESAKGEEGYHLDKIRFNIVRK